MGAEKTKNKKTVDKDEVMRCPEASRRSGDERMNQIKVQ